jgi:hypothetical protein
LVQVTPNSVVLGTGSELTAHVVPPSSDDRAVCDPTATHVCEPAHDTASSSGTSEGTDANVQEPPPSEVTAAKPAPLASAPTATQFEAVEQLTASKPLAFGNAPPGTRIAGAPSAGGVLDGTVVVVLEGTVVEEIVELGDVAIVEDALEASAVAWLRPVVEATATPPAISNAAPAAKPTTVHPAPGPELRGTLPEAWTSVGTISPR